MLSYPVEQSFRRDLRDSSTSFYVTFCDMKVSWLLVSKSMWDSIMSSDAAFCPTSLSTVLLKYLFRADGSACCALMFFCYFFSIWVFFHNQEKEEGISLTPHYHLHPLHKHLDISQKITAESPPLLISSSRTRIRSLWFLSASCLTLS